MGLETMSIATFSTHASFEGHAVMARLQAPPADVASFVFAEIRRRLMDEIANEVLTEHDGVTIEDVMSESRLRPICHARHHVWHQIATERHDVTVQAIADKFRRNHASVIHGIKAHSMRMNRRSKGLSA